nr:polyprotein [Alphaendornavirus sp.]
MDQSIYSATIYKPHTTSLRESNISGLRYVIAVMDHNLQHIVTQTLWFVDYCVVDKSDLSYTWQLTMKQRNKLMHAANGNISSVGSFAKLKKKHRTCWSDGSQKKANPFGKDNKNNAGLPNLESYEVSVVKIERIVTSSGLTVNAVRHVITNTRPIRKVWIKESPAPKEAHDSIPLWKMYKNAKKRLAVRDRQTHAAGVAPPDTNRLRKVKAYKSYNKCKRVLGTQTAKMLFRRDVNKREQLRLRAMQTDDVMEQHAILKKLLKKKPINIKDDNNVEELNADIRAFLQRARIERLENWLNYVQAVTAVLFVVSWLYLLSRLFVEPKLAKRQHIRTGSIQMPSKHHRYSSDEHKREFKSFNIKPTLAGGIQKLTRDEIEAFRYNKEPENDWSVQDDESTEITDSNLADLHLTKEDVFSQNSMLWPIIMEVEALSQSNLDDLLADLHGEQLQLTNGMTEDEMASLHTIGAPVLATIKETYETKQIMHPNSGELCPMSEDSNGDYLLLRMVRAGTNTIDLTSVTVANDDTYWDLREQGYVSVDECYTKLNLNEDMPTVAEYVDLEASNKINTEMEQKVKEHLATIQQEAEIERLSRIPREHKEPTIDNPLVRQMRELHESKSSQVKPKKPTVNPEFAKCTADDLLVGGPGDCWSYLPLFRMGFGEGESNGVDIQCIYTTEEERVGYWDSKTPMPAPLLLKILRYYKNHKEEFDNSWDVEVLDGEVWSIQVESDNMLHLQNSVFLEEDDWEEYGDDGEVVDASWMHGKVLGKQYTIEGILQELTTTVNNYRKTKFLKEKAEKANNNKPKELHEELEGVDIENCLVGAKLGDMRLNSVAVNFRIGEVPDTNTWKTLVDSHDLRAAALALAKVDHHVYKLPGMLNQDAIEKLINPDKGGWCLGMNVTFDNSLGPIFSHTATSEAAATHIGRQFFRKSGISCYNVPFWMDMNEHLPIKSSSKNALVFATRVGMSEDNMAALLRKHNNLILVHPTVHKDQPIHYTNTDGSYDVRRSAGKVMVVRSDMTQVISHSEDILDALSTKDYILSEKKMFKIIRVGNHEFDQVTMVTKVNMTTQSFENIFKFDYNSAMRQFNILMPVLDATLSVAMPTFKMRRVDIDGDLLRTICAHNLHRGDLTFRTLLTRCVGYAHRRYHMKHSIKAVTHLSNEQLMDHAYLAAVFVRRMYMTRRWLIDLGDRPSWVKKAEQHGIGLGNLALQALHEGSSGYREYEGWFNQVAANTRTSLHDFTDQAVFDEIEAWMFLGKTTDVQVHVLGSRETNIDCGHHKSIHTHTGKNACRCCFDPTDDVYCTCCQQAQCSDNHTCGHICNGLHEGGAICGCCSQPSDAKICKFCHKEEMDPEYEYEEGIFEAKVKIMGGSTKKASREDSGPHQVGTTPDGKAKYAALEPAKNMGGNKHLHKCAKCKKYYIHDHPYMVSEHPLFEGDCPWCEGNNTSIKTDSIGRTENEPDHGPSDDPVSKQEPRANREEHGDVPKEDRKPKEEQPDREAADSEGMEANALALIEKGYTVRAVAALRGNVGVWNSMIEWRSDAALNIPMLALGEHDIEIEAKNFKILKEIPEDATCGFMVIKEIYQNARLSTIINLLNKDKLFDDRDMAKIAEHYKLNLCIIGEKQMWVAKHTDQAWYDTLILSKPGHWQIGRADIEVKSVPTLTMISSASVALVDKAREIASRKCSSNADANLAAELSLLSREYVPSETLKFRIIGEWFTNNKKLEHKPALGLIAIKHKGAMTSKVVELINAETPDTYRKYLAEEWKHKEKTDVDEYVKMSMLNAAMSISASNNLGKGLTGEEMQYNFTVTNRTNSELVKIELPVDIKWMMGDMVRIVSANHDSMETIYPERLKGTERIVCRLRLPMGGSRYKMIYPKNGYVNNGTTIANMIRISSMIDMSPMEAINSDCLLGVPGFGKTYQIVQSATAKDLIVTATTGNKSGVREKLKEKFSNSPMPDLLGPQQIVEAAVKGKAYNKIFIDECTMFGAFEYRVLRTMVKTEKDIMLYGDDSQIGLTVFTSFRQIGEPTELQRFCRPENVKREYVSRRLGVEACEVASKVTGLPVTSKTGRHTKIKLYNGSDPAAMVSQILEQNKDINVILMFTRNTQKSVARLQLKIPVERVHGFQGREANKIIVLQEPPTPGQDVSVNPRYTYSAFTRAIEEIHWVSLGFNTNADIASRIGKKGMVKGFIGDAKMDKIKQFLKVRFGKSRLDDIQPVDILQTRVLEAAEAQADSMIPEDSKLRLMEYVKEQHGAIVTYEEEANNCTLIKISKHGVQGLILKYDGKKITLVEDKFNVMTQGKLNSIQAYIDQTDTKINWVEIGQWTEEEDALMQIVSYLSTDLQKVGCRFQYILDGNEYSIVHSSTKYGPVLTGFDINNNTQWNICLPDDDGTYLLDRDDDAVIDHIVSMNKNVNKMLIGGMNMMDVLASIRIKKMFSKGGEIIEAAARLVGIQKLDINANNFNRYLKKAKKANVRALYKYKMLNPLMAPEIRSIYMAQSDDGTVGWLTKEGQWIGAAEWRLASAMACMTAMTRISSAWWAKAARKIRKIREVKFAGAMNITIKDMADHFADETNTAQYIANRMGMIKAKMLKDETKPITVVPGTDQAWIDLITITMPNVGLHQTSVPTMIDGNAHMMQAVALKLVPQSRATYNVMSITPELTLEGGHYSWATVRPIGKAGAAEFDANMPRFDAIATSISEANVSQITNPEVRAKTENLVEMASKHLSGEVESWIMKYKPNMKGPVLVMPGSLDMNTGAEYDDQLEQMLKTNEVMLALPTMMYEDNNGNRVYETDHNQVAIINNDYHLATKISKQLYDTLLGGEGKIGQTNIHVDVFGCNEAVTIWKLNMGDRNDHYSPLPYSTPMAMTQIQVPVLTDNLIDMIASHKAKQLRTLFVDRRLYRSLSLRAMRENTTFEDLLVAARTMLHGVIYSPGGTAWKNKASTSKLMDTVAAVYITINKQVRNYEAAFRMMDGVLREGFLNRTKAEGANIIRGLLAHAQTILGLNLTEKELTNVLQASDSNVLRGMAEYLDGWNIRIDEYHRDVKLKGEDWLRTAKAEDTPRITDFAVANLLNWQSLTTKVTGAELRMQHPDSKVKDVKAVVRIEQEMTDDKRRWMVSEIGPEKTNEILNAINKLGAWPENLNSDVRVQQLYEAIKNRNGSKLKALVGSARVSRGTRQNTEEVLKQLQKYVQLRNAAYIPAADAMTLNRFISVADQLEWKMTKDQKMEIMSMCLEPEMMEEDDWNELISTLITTAQEMGSRLTRIRTVGRNINSMNILISAIGSRGDIRPAHNLAIQMANDGANVTLLCPNGSVTESQDVKYVYGNYDVEAELEKWHKVTNFSDEAMELILKDPLDNNWLKQVDYNKLDESYQLVIGSAVSPQGLMLAAAYQADYVDFCPMPLDNINGGWMRRIYRRLLSREYILLHGNAISEDFTSITGKECDLTKMLTRLRPYAQATDPALRDVEEGDIPTNAVGYWGMTNKYEKKDVLRLNPEIKTIITMGSMRDGKVAEALMANVNNKTSVVLTKKGSPLDLEAEKAGVRVMHGDYDLRMIPANLTVVHHGGAGTTSDLAMAGCWQVIVPISFDQKVWGETVTQKGIGSMVLSKDLQAGFDQYNSPRYIKLTHDPTKFNDQFCKTLAQSSGYSYSWNIRGSIFSSTSNDTWEEMMFNKPKGQITYGDSTGTIDEASISVVFDPAGRYPNEKNTCGARAINHVKKLKDDQLKLAISNIRTTWADLDEEGMDREQLVNLCLQLNLNPVVVVGKTAYRTVGSAYNDEIWLWWQDRGHIVVIDKIETIFDITPNMQRPVEEDMFDEIDCDEIAAKAAMWANEIKGDRPLRWHTDLHVGKKVLASTLKDVLSGRISTSPANDRLNDYNKHYARIVRDRIGSGMARERRPTTSWIRKVVVNVEQDRAFINEQRAPGALLAFLDKNGRYMLGVTTKMVEDKGTIVLLQGTGLNTTGIIADPHTWLTANEDRMNDGAYAKRKALNRETNSLLSLDLPIVKSSKKKESDELIVGYWDGYVHHWTNKFWNNYESHQVIFGEQIDEAFYNWFPRHNSIHLKPVVRGSEKMFALTGLQPNIKSLHKAVAGLYGGRTDTTFKVVWDYENDQVIEDLQVEVATHLDEKGRWKMPSWSMRMYDSQGDMANRIKELTGAIYTGPRMNRFKLEPTETKTSIAYNGLYYTPIGHMSAKSIDTPEAWCDIDFEGVIVRQMGPRAAELSQQYPDSILYMAPTTHNVNTIDLTEPTILEEATEQRHAFIFVDTEDDAARLITADQWPAGGFGDYKACPPSHQNRTGWIYDTNHMIHTYQGEVRSFDLVEMTNKQIMDAMEVSMTSGALSLSEARIGLGLSVEELQQIINYKGTDKFFYKTSIPSSWNGAKFEVKDEIITWRGTLQVAEKDYSLDGNRGIVTKVFTDGNYPVGDITYRTDEVSSLRNGKGEFIHHTTLTAEAQMDVSRIDTPMMENLKKIVKVMLAAAGNSKHIIITANADWTPQDNRGTMVEGAYYINITLRSRPQMGWDNYIMPLINNYETSLRQYRTILFYLAETDMNKWVTVVGGREDYNELAKGLHADKPKMKGVIKHMKNKGAEMVYLNNATGLVGTLNYADKFWMNDMQHYAQAYGTDELLLCRVAANHMRIIGVTLDKPKRVMPYVSYVVGEPTNLTVTWFGKSERQIVKKVAQQYNLPEDDDGLAIACHIKKIALEAEGEPVDYRNFVKIEDIVKSLDGHLSVRGQIGTVTTKGLVMVSQDATAVAEVEIPATISIKALTIRPGCMFTVIDLTDTVQSTVSYQLITRADIRAMHPSAAHPRIMKAIAYGYGACGNGTTIIVHTPTASKEIQQAAMDSEVSQTSSVKHVYKMGRLQYDVWEATPKENIVLSTAAMKEDAYNMAADLAIQNVRNVNNLTTGWPRFGIQQRRSDWPEYVTAPTIWEEEMVQMMGELSVHKQEVQAKGAAATLKRMVSAKAKSFLTTASIINELNQFSAMLQDGTMKEQVMEERDELLQSGVTEWARVSVQNKTKRCAATAFCHVAINKEQEKFLYLRNRGIYLKPATAGDMSDDRTEAMDPTIVKDEDYEEGLWWQTEEDSAGTGNHVKLDRSQDKHLQQGYRVKRGMDKEETENENDLVSWAYAMPDGEMKALKQGGFTPDWLVYHEDILTKNFHERSGNMDEAMINGQLKVQTRSVPNGKILLTYGKNTIDRKKFSYRGVLMLSQPISPQDIDARHQLVLDTEQPVHVSSSLDQHKDFLRGAKIDMQKEGLTTMKFKLLNTTMEGMTFNQINDYEEITSPAGSQNCCSREYLPLTEPGKNYQQQTETSEGVRDLVTDEIFAMWEDSDLTDHVRVNAPLNKGEGRGFQSNAMPIEVVEVEKTLLTPYPIEARPVLTKMAYGLENSVFNVLGSAIVYRKFDLDIQHETKEFVKAYGGPEAHEQIKSWKANPLYFDQTAMQNWLSGRTGIEAIDRELNDILSQGLFNEPINKLNVHMKLESLLKDTPITSFSQQQIRIIVWQKKGYAAMFSHVFLAAKSRLKAFLGPKFVYADGLTPQQLGNRTRNIKCKGFLEDDLTKQDRQTDAQTLQCEMSIYANVLGVHEDIVQLWRSAHEHWYFKGSTVKGRLSNMRHTGQATTAIGNVLVNLLVHRRLVNRLGGNLKLMMVLGDDNLMLSDSFIDAQRVRREIRNFWNMESKAEFQENYGIFLRMMASKNESGNVQMGPDFVRLRRRFEVTNGQNESTPEKIEARVLSYACMLGDIPGIQDIVNTINPNLEVINWYDMAPQVEAVSEKYFQHLDPTHRAAAVYEEINLLKSMMRKREMTVRKWQHFTTAEVAKRK